MHTAGTRHALRVVAQLALASAALSACAAAVGGGGDGGSDGATITDTARPDVVGDAPVDVAVGPEAGAAVPCSTPLPDNAPCATLNEVCPPNGTMECLPIFHTCQPDTTGQPRWQRSGCAVGPMPPPELAA